MNFKVLPFIFFFYLDCLVFNLIYDDEICFRHIPQGEQDSIQDHGCYVVDENSKKLLFKKRSTSSTCAVRL